MSTPKFKRRDAIRDRNTGTVVMVADPDRDNPQRGNPARGFSWVNMDRGPGDPDHTGFCPHASDGCYELVPPTRRERIAAVLRKNLPTLARLFRKRELENRESLHDLGHELYGRHDYRDGWQAQVCRPYGEPYLAFEDSEEIEYDKPWGQAQRDAYAEGVRDAQRDAGWSGGIGSGKPTPTREQILAATVASGWFVSDAWEPGKLVDPVILAGDALAVAREIISQSERSGGTETSPDKSG